MKNIKALFLLITVIFVLTACQSVSTKIDKTTENAGRYNQTARANKPRRRTKHDDDDTNDDHTEHTR